MSTPEASRTASPITCARLTASAP